MTGTPAPTATPSTPRRRLMFWVIVSVAVVAILVATMNIVGATLPRDHVATVRARYTASPESVWSLLSDPYAAPGWRRDVTAVEGAASVDGHESWTERSRSGTITYVLIESTPLKSRTSRIVDEGLPYGGQWEYALRPDGGGTELTVTERGFIKPAMFRFMARFVFGYTSTMRDVLVALGEKLGETVSPEVVAAGR